MLISKEIILTLFSFFVLLFFLRKFPQNDNEKGIVSIGLTNDFLIMLDAGGKIRYFHLEDRTFVVEYKPADC